MCGIAGIIQFSPSQPLNETDLSAMADALVHRGPDDSGIWLSDDRQVGLAHRRLSVIDIHGGHQPFSDPHQQICLTYNGECYNFPELKTDLEKKGYNFRTRCDTEVVFNLYREFGPACVDYIRGMFAFALWDGPQKLLFLARDRMGQKPLYYTRQKNRFIFASECKAILKLKNISVRPDIDALSQFLLRFYIPSDRSAFSDICQLPPGCRMTLTPDNFTTAQPETYWTIPPEPTFTGNLNDAADRLRTTLTNAVRMRMVSDVPLGAFLSGGLDSALITALMNQQSQHPVTTCSIGFDDEIYNELPLARITARQNHTQHYEFMVKPDCAQTIEKLSYFYDEPFADSSALPTYHLSHLARSKVTVALTGDGGDECFGGYDRYRALRLSEKIRHTRLLEWLMRRKFWQRLPSGEFRSFRHRLKRFVSSLNLPVARRYLDWIALFQPDHLETILKNTNMLQGLSCIPDQFVSDSESIDHLIAQTMLFDGREYLPGDLNTKIDRASMSIGLELRCPFQDHKLVELAYSLPASFRHNGKLGKIILRHTFRDLIAPQILKQKKRGFGVPVGKWFRHELKDLFYDTVLSPRALQRGYFHKTALENLFQENENSIDDHGHRLWGLLMLELWHRRYIDT